MGRQKYIKNDHMKEANILLENKWLQRKNLLGEANIPAPNCWSNCPNPQAIYHPGAPPCPSTHPNTTEPNCAQPNSACPHPLGGGTTCTIFRASMLPCGNTGTNGTTSGCFDLQTTNPSVGEVFTITSLANMTGNFASFSANVGDTFTLTDIQSPPCPSVMLPTHQGVPTFALEPAGCTTPCDTTTASPCAVQWWQNPNATWAANWINNRDCSNYTWPATNLEQQATAILNTAPNLPTIPYTFNDWNDIWGAANASGLVNPQKGQFIGKMAKAKYSQCQKQACNC